MEIKNKLTVTRGKGGGVTGKEEEGSRNMYKAPMVKDNGVRIVFGSRDWIWGRGEQWVGGGEWG